MPDPLLTTKLYIPPARPQRVPRPRLTARLSQGLTLPLTLIAAPAGFGKTTVLSEWQASPAGQQYPLAWLSLDAGDNDPLRFWTYVVAALRALPAFAAAERFGQTALEALAAPQVAPARCLTPLINEAAAHPGPFALVLDDYHAISAQAIHDAVFFLVEHLPPCMHLVVLSRADPPWPLARLRANGRMAELRAADLRFTPAEVAQFLNQVMAFGLSPEEIAALERRTEGWVAALQMIALSLAGHPDRHGFVTAFAGDHRYIADYLAEEVLSRQAGEVQQFLLHTAVLERLCAPLGAAVTGQDNAGALLEQIERAGLFLIPLDAERRWYRYHHLFADLLRARLQHAQPDLVPGLHLRAAGWYRQHGLGAEAVHHALAAGDYDLAAGIIEQNAHQWWAAAASSYWLLVAKLPPEVIRSRPTLCLHQAWGSILAGQLEAAAALIGDAEQHLQGPGPGGAPEAAAMGSFLSLMRTYIAELTGQVYTVTDLDRQGPAYIPEQNVAMRNSADVMLAYVLTMNGDLDQAAAILTAAANRDLAYNTSNAIPIAMAHAARLRMIQGRLREAEQICRHSLAAIAERGAARFFVAGNLNAVLADVLREQNDLEAALAQAREAEEQNRAWPFPGATAMALGALARVLLAQGRPDEAAAVLAREEQATRGRWVATDTVIERNVLKVRLWLARGDLAAATAWAQESRLGARDALSFRRERGHLALARVLLARGQAEDARALLARLAEAAAAGGRTGRLIEILVLQALALRALGQPGRGAEVLARAVALAQPEGYMRVFLDEGEPVAELLAGLAGDGPGAAYAARILGAGGRTAPMSPAPALVEPLSAREREILHLVAAGLSNQGIATRLTVSVGTVKTHVHNVMGKLGARSRTQALARARELRLL